MLALTLELSDQYKSIESTSPFDDESSYMNCHSNAGHNDKLPPKKNTTIPITNIIARIKKIQP